MPVITFNGLAGQDTFRTGSATVSVTVNAVSAPFTAVRDGFRLNTPLANNATVAADIQDPVSGLTVSDPTNGNPADAEATDNGSIIAILKRLRTILGGTLVVSPQMAGGGNLSVQTANPGTNWTTFAAQACRQLTVVNDTGTALEVRQGGAGVGLRVPNGVIYTFFGITNANQIGVKRVDSSNTQVTVTARWES